jgi:hypothetical protein
MIVVAHGLRRIRSKRMKSSFGFVPGRTKTPE